MSIDKSANQLTEKRDFVNILILLIIALGIGIYLILTTTLIAKDGMSYINYAKGLDVDFLGVIRDSSEYAPRLYTPGYPFLILIIHKLAALFADGTMVTSWIYSAQTATLLCRILALIPLYFIGKELIGSKLSFWAMLVLVILPYPARYGSDALRAWPHILFLATGFLFLIWGAKYKKWLMFGAAGLTAGMGYTVRPMCAQLIFYGMIWLIYNMLRKRHKCNISRVKLLGGILLLLIGFAVVVAPYMKLRGEYLPNRLKQVTESFTLNFERDNILSSYNSLSFNARYTAGLSLEKSNITAAFVLLISRISEHLMYYFTPFLFIGTYCYFKRKPKNETMFLITVFLLTNVAMMVLRYCIHPDLSRRYILPMIAFGIFFVPQGLQFAGKWTGQMCMARKKQGDFSQKDLQRWFFVLLIIGLTICLPKLLKPIRNDKLGYRKAANWLYENTANDDTIAVFDERISFYAQRTNFLYASKNVLRSEYNIENQSVGQKKLSDIVTAAAYIVTENKKKNGADADIPPLLASRVPLKGLVAYWLANDANDYSIYSNNLTVNGRVAYTMDKYGNAFDLTNGDAYLRCQSNAALNPANSITLSVWIFPITSSTGSILTKNGPYSVEFCKDSRVRVGIHTNPPSWTFVRSSTELALNTWSHVAVTYDGSYIRLYINGQMDGTPTTKSGEMTKTFADVFIGYGRPGLDHYFDGLIDEVMIFQQALVPDKIRILYEIVKSHSVPTFEKRTNCNELLDYWKVEKVYPLKAEEQDVSEGIEIYMVR